MSKIILKLIVFLVLVDCGLQNQSGSDFKNLAILGLADKRAGVVQSSSDNETNGSPIDFIDGIGGSNGGIIQPAQGKSLFRIKLSADEEQPFNAPQGVKLDLRFQNIANRLTMIGLGNINDVVWIRLKINEINITSGFKANSKKIQTPKFIFIRPSDGRVFGMPFVKLRSGDYTNLKIDFSAQGVININNKIYNLDLDNTTFSLNTPFSVTNGKITNVRFYDSQPGGQVILSGARNLAFETKRSVSDAENRNVRLSLNGFQVRKFETESLRSGTVKVNSVKIVYSNGTIIPINTSTSSFELSSITNGNVALISSKSVNSGAIKEIQIFFSSEAIANYGTENEVSNEISELSRISIPVSANLTKDQISEFYLEISPLDSFALGDNSVYEFRPILRHFGGAEFEPEIYNRISEVAGKEMNLALKKSYQIVIGRETLQNTTLAYVGSGVHHLITIGQIAVTKSILNDAKLNSINYISPGGTVGSLTVEGYGMPRFEQNIDFIYFLGKNESQSESFLAHGVFSKIPLLNRSDSQAYDKKLIRNSLQLRPINGQYDFANSYKKELLGSINSVLGNVDVNRSGANISTEYYDKPIDLLTNTEIADCSKTDITDLALSGNVIYLMKEPDWICTSKICSYRWHCGTDENSIIRTDLFISGNHNVNNDLEVPISKAVYNLTGVGECNLGSNGCLSNSNDPNAPATPFFDESKKAEIRNFQTNGLKVRYGLPLIVDQNSKLKSQEFKTKADAYCNPSPCVYPELETDNRFRPQYEETQYYNEYLVYLEGEGIAGPEKYLQFTKEMQDIYKRITRNVGAKAEIYMIQAIENTNSKLSSMPSEYIRENTKLLFYQIQKRKEVLEGSSEDLDTRFREFLESETKVLIQIRREHLKRLN
ncbi:hypothetical protein AB3N59_20190 (plasmid) [Leptospira sp. WS92.C1]